MSIILLLMDFIPKVMVRFGCMDPIAKRNWVDASWGIFEDKNSTR